MSAEKQGAFEVQAISFDCYGTLIDWDGGIDRAFADLASLEGADPVRLAVDRAEMEQDVQRGSYRPYGEVLRRTLRAAARKQNLEPTAAELAAFAASIQGWPPFPDSHDALLLLAERYQLVLLSNVETHVLEKSIALLDAPFAACVTAEEVRSYKPRPAHFQEGLARLDLDANQVVHVAGSLYHDIRPASALGWRTVWVNRLDEPLPADVTPDLVVPDMASAAAALCP